MPPQMLYGHRLVGEWHGLFILRSSETVKTQNIKNEGH